MESLRGHTSGLGVPTYVIDAPGDGKIPLMPNYLVSAAPGRVVLRNFEGALFSYPDAGSPANGHYKVADSVSDLASGKSDRLIPEGQSHYQRRESLAIEQTLANLDHAVVDTDK